MDIYGTYESIDNKYLNESKNQKIILFYLMDKIRKLNNCDEVVFSFSSTSDLEDIRKFYYDAFEIIDECNTKYQTNLSLGPQMGENGYYNPYIDEDVYEFTKETKCQKMITIGGTLEENNYDIQEVIYIDDNPSINVAIGVLDKRYQQVLIDSINLVLIGKGETGQEILKKLGKNDDVNIYSQLSSENYEFAKEGLRKVLEIKETNKKCQNKDK